MKHSIILIVITNFLIFSCQTAGNNDTGTFYIPDTPNPMKETEAIALDKMESSEPSIVVDFETPEIENSEVIEAEETLEETAVVEKLVEDNTFIIKQETFNGGAVNYNYVENHIYKVFVGMYKTTDIKLEPGEKIISNPVAGDTYNFQLGNGASVENSMRVTHLYIKPMASGKNTNLIVNTDRRTYHFQIFSYKETFMPMISFSYPQAFDINIAGVGSGQTNASTNGIYLQGYLTDFEFGYEVIPMSLHAPQWIPNLVFSDTQKTYISFASASRASYAPVLFLIEDGKRVLVNYRVHGSYYIVDFVIEHAELVLDVNAGNIVTIKKIRK